MISIRFAMNWWKNLKGKVRRNELLKHHTTFKIGGPAKFFIEPKDADELRLLLNLLKRYKLSTFVIGAGSNILISDKGINGAVLRLNSAYFKKINRKGNSLTVGSGTLLNQALSLCKRCGLSGLEFLVGIPGTVGGALVMNAGLPGKNIADFIENVRVMDYNGNIKTLNKKNIKFGYRISNLSKYIILSAHLKLSKGTKEEINNRISGYLNYRRRTQDLSWPSAGCIFKNPPGYSAGQLIDLCGLKGKKISGARVSMRHANFILNLKDAKAKDVLKLMGFIKKKVKNKFNINLEPEIKIWQ